MIAKLAEAVVACIALGYADTAAVMARMLAREAMRRSARRDERRREMDEYRKHWPEVFEHRPIVYRDGKAFVGRFNGHRYVFAVAS